MMDGSFDFGGVDLGAAADLGSSLSMDHSSPSAGYSPTYDCGSHATSPDAGYVDLSYLSNPLHPLNPMHPMYHSPNSVQRASSAPRQFRGAPYGGAASTVAPARMFMHSRQYVPRQRPPAIDALLERKGKEALERFERALASARQKLSPEELRDLGLEG